MGQPPHPPTKKVNKCVCRCINVHVRFELSPHPVVGQLKGQLDVGVRTDAALLDHALAKVPEREDVEVHIVGQRLGHCQRLGDLLLTLGQREEGKRQHWILRPLGVK